MNREDALRIIRSSMERMTDEQVDAFAAIVYAEVHEAESKAA